MHVFMHTYIRFIFKGTDVSRMLPHLRSPHRPQHSPHIFVIFPIPIPPPLPPVFSPFPIKGGSAEEKAKGNLMHLLRRCGY